MHCCVFVVVTLLFQACKEEENKVVATEETGSGYPISPVNIQHVKITDDFWLPIIQRVQEKTIAYAIDKCEEEGRLDNFLVAGGQMEGEVKGAMPFDDSDVYKIIEGASNSLISAPNPSLEKQLDSLIAIIKIGQEEDGYLTTWRTINPAKPPASWVEVKEGKRWESLFMSHELYNAGHMYEAAVVHYKATGKRNFLNLALKNADLMVQTFGDKEGQISAVPGHQIIETGLIQLYQVTRERKYLDLGRYFLENRGNPDNHELFGAYSQDHVPVTEQDEVVGHAVRAVYMYAGMTDIAAIDHDNDYLKASENLWNNMVHKKMYITGGIGAIHDGEKFGENYELPNLTAYSETCAAIGDVYWSHRMHRLTADVKYLDVLERTLYNGLISGLSLDGTHFFYPNALEADGEYEFNRGDRTRQAWFDCSCCPTNLIRFIPSLPGLLYAKENNTIYVNLYASNEATINLKNQGVRITEQTQYPWNGKVQFTIQPEKEEEEITLKFRIPGWVRNEVLPGDLYHYLAPSDQKATIVINGEVMATKEKDGYFVITQQWKKGDQITLDFPMEVREVVTNPLVPENTDKVSLEYGPLVYAVEEADNATHFKDIAVKERDHFTVEKKADLLGGVNTISTPNFTAIPYYAWSNRGIGKMKVWLPVQQ